MADTRLQAVATADDRQRRASVGIRESVAAFAVAGPTGHYSAGAPAVTGTSMSSVAGHAPGYPADRSAFAHTFQSLRPTFVRAGAAARSGHPHGRSSWTGLPCGRRAHVLGALGQSVLQEGVAHSLWKVAMGPDCDLSAVAAS